MTNIPPLKQIKKITSREEFETLFGKSTNDDVVMSEFFAGRALHIVATDNSGAVKPGLYWWVRDVDETGMSGSGRVAQVAVFEDGSGVVRWLKARNAVGVSSFAIYESAVELLRVHGHGDKKTGHLEPV